MPETLRVIDKLNAVDNEIFFCDIRKIDWQYYVIMMWRGLKYYVLNEPYDREAILRRYRLLLTVHYSLIVILLYIFYCFMMRLF